MGIRQLSHLDDTALSVYPSAAINLVHFKPRLLSYYALIPQAKIERKQGHLTSSMRPTMLCTSYGDQLRMNRSESLLTCCALGLGVLEPWPRTLRLVHVRRRDPTQMVSSSSQLCKRDDSPSERDSSHSFDCCFGMPCTIFESLVYPEDEEWLAVYHILVDMLIVSNIGKLPFPDSAISTMSTSARLRA